MRARSRAMASCGIGTQCTVLHRDIARERGLTTVQCLEFANRAAVEPMTSSRLIGAAAEPGVRRHAVKVAGHFQHAPVRMSGFPEQMDARPAALPDGAQVFVLTTAFHRTIVAGLLEGARSALDQRAVPRERQQIIEVPGAWELPLAAALAARSGRANAIVALGCVIRGETRHFEHIADGCAQGLMRVQIESGVPIGNAVLAVELREHAEARAVAGRENKGYQAAMAALDMLAIAGQLH